MNENMELYKYFYAVAQTGNISAAAKQLYTSQPGCQQIYRKIGK